MVGGQAASDEPEHPPKTTAAGASTQMFRVMQQNLGVQDKFEPSHCRSRPGMELNANGPHLNAVPVICLQLPPLTLAPRGRCAGGGADVSVDPAGAAGVAEQRLGW